MNPIGREVTMNLQNVEDKVTLDSRNVEEEVAMDSQKTGEELGKSKPTFSMHCSPGGLFAIGKLLSDNAKKRVKEVGFQHILKRPTKIPSK